MSDSEGLLSGLKVLDLTHYVAGPYTTRLMATQGAEVVKVDGAISPGEVDFFDEVGKAFKLNPSEIADLKK